MKSHRWASCSACALVYYALTYDRFLSKPQSRKRRQLIKLFIRPNCNVIAFCQIFNTNLAYEQCLSDNVGICQANVLNLMYEIKMT